MFIIALMFYPFASIEYEQNIRYEVNAELVSGESRSEHRTGLIWTVSACAPTTS